jgi:hypothetical protein
MKTILVTGLMSLAALAGSASPAAAGLLSAKGPVIAILHGDLFLGEAEGHLDGSGTLKIWSRADPTLSCSGQFSRSPEKVDTGSMRCTDGATATFQFQRLSVLRGYGTGSSSLGDMSFTYGLNADDSAKYLKLPAGKVLKMSGKDLQLVEIR